MKIFWGKSYFSLITNLTFDVCDSGLCTATEIGSRLQRNSRLEQPDCLGKYLSATTHLNWVSQKSESYLLCPQPSGNIDVQTFRVLIRNTCLWNCCIRYQSTQLVRIFGETFANFCRWTLIDILSAGESLSVYLWAAALQRVYCDRRTAGRGFYNGSAAVLTYGPEIRLAGGELTQI